MLFPSISRSVCSGLSRSESRTGGSVGYSSSIGADHLFDRIFQRDDPRPAPVLGKHQRHVARLPLHLGKPLLQGILLLEEEAGSDELPQLVRGFARVLGKIRSFMCT